MAKAGRYRVCTTFRDEDAGGILLWTWRCRNRYFKTLAGLRRHLLKAIGEDFYAIFVEDQDNSRYPITVADIPCYRDPTLVPDSDFDRFSRFVFADLNKLLDTDAIQDAWKAKFT